MKNKAIVILSPPRSGSSALCRMLKAMGLKYGSADLLVPPGPSNPHGFFEYKDVLDLNESILKYKTKPYIEDILTQFGLPEDEIFNLSKSRFWCASSRQIENSHELQSLFGAKIEQVLNRINSVSDVVVLKDARFCMTLPVWAPHIDIIPIILYRNPGDSSQSIKKMSGIPLEYAQWLWGYYSYASIKLPVNLSPLLISFDELCQSPISIASKIEKFLEKEGVNLEINREAIETAFDPSIVHTESDVNNLPEPLFELYQWLQNGGQGEPPTLPPPNYSAELLPLISVCRGIIKRGNRYRDRVDEVSTISNELRYRLRAIEARTRFQRFKEVFR